MPSPRRFLIACGLVCASLLVLSSAASAEGRHGSSAPAPTGQSSTAPAKTGCDVPGKSCDPSKTDHDNGVGNSCDPGYGQGNQAKFAPDEATTSCRTKSSETKSPETENKSPETTTSGPPAPCATTTTVKHSDNESTSGSMHESTTAEDHDSHTVTKTDSDQCQETGEVESIVSTTPVTVTIVEKGGETVTITIEKVVLEGSGNNVILTLTGIVNGETKTFEFRLPAEITEISGVTMNQLPGGGFTLTFPNGTVLTFTGGVLSANGTTVAPGTSTTVSGMTLVNSGSAPAGTTAPATVTVPGRGAAMGLGLGLGNGAGVGGVLGAVESAGANAANGVGLAATGLPILGGLVGLALFLTGLAIRRRS